MMEEEYLKDTTIPQKFYSVFLMAEVDVGEMVVNFEGARREQVYYIDSGTLFKNRRPESSNKFKEIPENINKYRIFSR